MEDGSFHMAVGLSELRLTYVNLLSWSVTYCLTLFQIFLDEDRDISICVLANLQDVSLFTLASNLSDIFQEEKPKKSKAKRKEN